MKWNRYKSKIALSARMKIMHTAVVSTATDGTSHGGRRDHKHVSQVNSSAGIR